MKVLVTGARGFVGQALLKRLASERDVEVVAAARGASSVAAEPAVRFDHGDLSSPVDWREPLRDVEVVIHLAARVHQMGPQVADALEDFRAINVRATASLARQAAETGVKRFLFLSSVKIHGDEGLFSESDPPRPTGSYAVSKWEAEQELRRIAQGTELEVVVIRPPLVYGPGVRANFQSLVRAVRSGIPLPLGAIHNLRSFVAVDNLVDFLLFSTRNPAAANEAFLVSDGHDLSTPELIFHLARALNRPSRLIPVPATVLRVGAAVAGKRAWADRLLLSLQVDISKARAVLGWSPPVSVDEGLRRAVTVPPSA